MKLLIKKEALLILLIFYVLVLMVGFVIVIPKNIGMINNNDKLIHFIEFFILTILVLKTFQAYNIKRFYFYGIIFLVFFVFLSESIQAFLPYRSFSFYDIVADLLGIIIGFGVFKWIFYRL
ncbi:MAG: VanZ family protein [Candidatus Woesearchaeota archaeon]